MQEPQNETAPVSGAANENKLSPRSYLESRAIPSAMAESLGIRWLGRDAAIAKGFGKLATSPHGVILFPSPAGDIARNFYPDEAAAAAHLEAINRWRQSRDVAPVTKVPKYIAPSGSDRYSLYDPYPLLHPGEDLPPPILATEDVIGVAKAAIRGIRIVSTFGVWLASKEDIAGSCDKEFTHRFSGKFPVFLADSDALENPHVAAALTRTGLILDCAIGFFPSQGEGKIGLDEWLDLHPDAGADQIAAMIEEQAADPIEWIGTFINEGIGWLQDRGHSKAKATKIYGPIRDAILNELLKHYSIEDLRGNGFYSEYLKPIGITLGVLRERQPKKDGDDAGGDSVFDLLMAISSDCQFWHSDEDIAYADLLVDGIMHTYPVRSKNFKTWLAQQCWERHGKGINSEAMSATLNVLDAKGISGPERAVYLRSGADEDGGIYLDLGNDRWEIIKIDRNGWRVIQSQDCPIRFTRPSSQLPIPYPIHGDISQLWEFLKIGDKYKPLLIAWLLSCLVPWGDKPIVILTGSKGAGKTTTGEILKAIIDPGKAGLLPKIGDARNLAAAARNRWLLIFDNLSSLSIEDQDNLCRTATGAGFSHRQLFTDLDETFVEYRRPQILTSVEFIPTKSDLLDRSILIGVDRLSEDQRIPKSDLEEKFAAAAPAILGGLLDLLVTGLRNLDTVTGPLPRMTDYARLAIAAGIPKFQQQYLENIETAEEAAIEASPVAAAIRDLIAQHGGHWQGSATSLLAAIREMGGDDPVLRKMTARSLGKKLAGTLAADLAAIGIDIDSYRDTGRKRERQWIFSARLPDQPQIKTSETSGISAQSPEPLRDKGSSHPPVSGVSSPAADVLMPDIGKVTPNVRKTSEAETLTGQGFQPSSDVLDVSDVSDSLYLSGGGEEFSAGGGDDGWEDF